MQKNFNEKNMDNFNNQEELIQLLRTRMPFGKYKGRYLMELPEPYLVWFRQQGFPKGKLGEMLATMYEIKLNGLESMLQPLFQQIKKADN